MSACIYVFSITNVPLSVLGMQVYLLILIYSLLCKVRGAGRHECENHITGVVLGGYSGAALGDHEELCQ